MELYHRVWAMKYMNHDKIYSAVLMEVYLVDYKIRTDKEDKKNGTRLGKLHTPHGIIDTPVFMPVGHTSYGKGYVSS